MLLALIVPGIALGIACIVAGYTVLRFTVYKLPITIAGLCLMIFFIYQYGRYNEITKNKIIVAALQMKLAEFREQASEVTIETVIKYVDRIKYVQKIKEVPVKVYITSESNDKCVIDSTTSNNIRMLLNSSNSGQVPGASKQKE